MAPAIQRPSRLAMISSTSSAMLCADQRKEGAGKVGPAPFPRAGVHVEIEEGVPGVFGDVAAGEGVNRDAVGQRHRAVRAGSPCGDAS